ncbi:E3 ubiquitin/ISG15 ligase TRIM25-like [Aquarana catesbeiana]|uniref:E3 ubiquitin/ISG15 ligase TRIM25-like n=1 Tax=Aquarana catesbeiana TaxID=8400 RepID=UPI003CC9296D
MSVRYFQFHFSLLLSAMASAYLKKELECSICLDFYTDPVTLNCGHNFCRECIDRVLATQKGSGDYSCPECQQRFRKRPALQRNLKLRNIVENFQSTHPDQEDTGVFCTYCIHTPVPAVKSCLHCEASLCDNHLRVHSTSTEHVLCDPNTSWESRKCSIHKELLKYYCTEDSTCICVSCSLVGEHRGHQVESLDVAFEMKKKTLRNVLPNLMRKTEETGNGVQRLQEQRRKVQGKADDEIERITTLFRDLRRQLEDLEKRVLSEVCGQTERVCLSLSDVIGQLEKKKDELSKKMAHIKNLCNMTDPVSFLQNSDTGNLCDPEDGDERCDKLQDGEDLDVAGISHTLQTGLSDIMSGVNVQTCTGTHVYPHSSPKKKAHNAAEPSRPHHKSAEPSRPPHQTDRPSRPYHQPGGPSRPYHQQDGPSRPYHQQDGPSRPYHQPDEPSRPYHQPDEPSRPYHQQDGPSRQHHQPASTVQHSHWQAGGPNIGVVHQPSGLSGFTDSLLDVNTAGNDLHISDDGKTATWSEDGQNRPETANRFQYPQVLSRQSFSSGQHFWDVDVRGAEYWRVGMCYPSMDRRGWPQSGMGYNSKSWCLERLWNNQYLATHDGKGIRLFSNVSSNIVRIDLDYEAGRISFYDLCVPIRHLHTFTTTFTEPLHAGLYVLEGCIKISGGNTV